MTGRAICDVRHVGGGWSQLNGRTREMCKSRTHCRDDLVCITLCSLSSLASSSVNFGGIFQRVVSRIGTVCVTLFPFLLPQLETGQPHHCQPAGTRCKRGRWLLPCAALCHQDCQACRLGYADCTARDSQPDGPPPRSVWARADRTSRSCVKDTGWPWRGQFSHTQKRLARIAILRLATRRMHEKAEPGTCPHQAPQHAYGALGHRHPLPPGGSTRIPSDRWLIDHRSLTFVTITSTPVRRA